jgi:tetratricopeptide (TPR) repeat protein
MKPVVNVITLLLLLGLASPPCNAQDHARTFISGVEAYADADYAKAIERFTSIARSGVQNGKLYYNLGNAHLKNGDLGVAILWYERALKLIPNDPDLTFNLEFARTLTKDAPEAESPLLRIFFFWKYQLSAQTVTRAAIGLSLIFWVVLIAWRITRRRTLRRIAIAVCLPALIMAITAGHAYFQNVYRRTAIVLPEKTAVRSGLQTDSTELFTLHAGAKVTVMKTHKDHFQIRFSKDKIGWVRQDEVGIIEQIGG